MKITRRQQKLISSLLMCSLIIIVGVALVTLDIDINNPFSLFGDSHLAYFVVAVLVWFVMYQQVSRAQIIPETKVIKVKQVRISNVKNQKIVSQRRSAVWAFLSYGIGVAFGLWFCIQMVAATLNPNHIVINHYNAFDEFWFELVLVFFATIVVIRGFVEHLKVFKVTMQPDVSAVVS